MESKFWSSPEHQILLSPHWPAEVSVALLERAQQRLLQSAREPSLVLATSGSTANIGDLPKLVFISKKNFLSAAQVIVEHFQMQAHEKSLCALPTYHVGGLAVLARAYLSKGQVLDLHQQKWNVETFYQLITSEKINVISLVPTQVYDLVQKNFRSPPCLRLVFVGGGQLSEVLARKALDLGWPLILTYGMTETSAMVAYRDLRENANLLTDKNQSYQAFRDVEFSSDENECLMIRSMGLAYGVSITKAYQEMWLPIQSDSGYVTQDQVNLLSPQSFQFKGRLHEQIKILGENVDVQVLRDKLEFFALEKKLDPRRFYLFARKQERSENELVLCVEKGFDPVTLLQDYNASVHLPFEKIRIALEIEKIPRSALGKVLDQELRMLTASGQRLIIEE